MRVEEMASLSNGSVAKMSDVDRAHQVAMRFDPVLQVGSLLSASRRVDWRFLLPEPLLGNVICIEPSAHTLAQSLQIFSASLARLKLDNGSNTGQMEPGDVVVVCDPSQSTVERAAAFVKAGGHIYIEAHGPTSLLKRSRRTHSVDPSQRRFWWPMAYTRRLRALGFAELQLHWHWPDFQSCKMIIPLDQPAAAHLALDRGGQGVKARLRTGVGRVLVRSGLLPWMVPCFSVLARRRVE